MARERTSLFQLERSASAATQHRATAPRRRKRDLRSLELATIPQVGSNKLMQSQSYDDGGAIMLRTASGSFSMYPEQMSASTSPRTHARALEYPGDVGDADDIADVFYVEPFEEPEATSSPAAPQPNPAAPAITAPPPTPAAPTITAPQPATHPAAAPVESPPASVAEPPAVIPTPPAPVANPVDDDENFEDDIQAILDRAAMEPQKPEPPVPIISKPKPEAPQPETPDAGQPQQAGTAQSHGHEIFDAMALGLGSATTFDLGAVDLNRRFNEIEKQLNVEDRAEQQKALAASFSDAASLDDADLIDDLSAVSSLLEERLKQEQSEAPATPDPDNSAATPAPIDVAPPAAPRTPPVEAEPATPPDAQTPPAAAEPAAPPVATPGSMLMDVVYKVPAAQATTTVPAPAAGAAMLIAWRDQSAIDMQALAAGSGSWAAYAPGLKASGPEFFTTWGMKELSPEPLTLELLHTSLKAHGPLWLQNPAVESAIRIVTGLSGDGTDSGTSITIIDPAAGAQSAQQTANINSLITHLGGGPVRAAHLVS